METLGDLTYQTGSVLRLLLFLLFINCPASWPEPICFILEDDAEVVGGGSREVLARGSKKVVSQAE